MRKSFSENRNDSSSSTTMLQTKLSLPFSKFGKAPELDEFNFNKAIDHLSRVAEIIKNQVIRQHYGLAPSARSIISLIDHMCDTINIALVAIEKTTQKFEHPGEQTDSEEALKIALEGWGRFTERPRTSVRELAALRQEVHFGCRSRSCVTFYLNQTASLSYSMLRNYSIERCKVTVSHPDPFTTVSMMEFEDESGIKTKHNIFPILDSAQAGPQSDSLELRSSLETLRIVQEWQLPLHNRPIRESVYVFRSETGAFLL
jgi:hypothetical protein